MEINKGRIFEALDNLDQHSGKDDPLKPWDQVVAEIPELGVRHLLEDAYWRKPNHRLEVVQRDIDLLRGAGHTKIADKLDQELEAIKRWDLPL